MKYTLSSPKLFLVYVLSQQQEAKGRQEKGKMWLSVQQKALSQLLYEDMLHTRYYTGVSGHLGGTGQQTACTQSSISVEGSLNSWRAQN